MIVSKDSSISQNSDRGRIYIASSLLGVSISEKYIIIVMQ